MKSFSMTDQGRVRSSNQDYLFTCEKPLGNLSNLFIVADGMGGHNAGEYASKYAVETIVKEISSCIFEEPVRIFRNAIETANRKLLEKSMESPWFSGMGTTVVMATISEENLLVANVGDSRLYVLNETITQITKDHSHVEELIRLGQIDREEAKKHPDKHVLTRALGVEKKIMTDIFEVDLQKTDKILLCTDGLTNMLEDQEILTTIKGQRDLAEIVEKLVEGANQNGGRDNITAVVIEPFSNEVKTC